MFVMYGGPIGETIGGALPCSFLVESPLEVTLSLKLNK